MKTQLFLLLCIIVGLTWSETSNAQVNEGKTNLFAWGTPVVTCEDNFSNFFLNFSEYVKNADMINFLGYHYVGIVKSKTHAKRYLRKNFDSKMYKWGFSVSIRKDGVQKDSWLTFIKDPTPDFYKITDMINTIATEYIQTGDQIYALKFIFEGKTHEYFIFCDSQTQHVVNYGNIFGLKLTRDFFVRE